MDTKPHIVSSYDTQLGQLGDLIARMAGLTERQLFGALQALVNRDDARADQVRDADDAVDGLETEVNEQVVRLLALRNPVADDLRMVIAGLKVANDLERVGDLSANVAKRAKTINQLPPAQPVKSVNRLGLKVMEMLAEAMNAYAQADAEKARAVWTMDKEVDELYSSLFREILTYMMEDPRQITACSHLMFIAKNIERIGDHATNIAEEVHYQATGRVLEGDRPKDDAANFIAADNDTD